MAKREQAGAMSERFFIRTTPDVRKRLLHLAIDLEGAVEKLAGVLLADALARATPESLKRYAPLIAKDKPPRDR
jgi:hypothetical protein